MHKLMFHACDNKSHKEAILVVYRKGLRKLDGCNYLKLIITHSFLSIDTMIHSFMKKYGFILFISLFPSHGVHALKQGGAAVEVIKGILLTSMIVCGLVFIYWCIKIYLTRRFTTQSNLAEALQERMETGMSPSPDQRRAVLEIIFSEVEKKIHITEPQQKLDGIIVDVEDPPTCLGTSQENFLVDEEHGISNFHVSLEYEVNSIDGPRQKLDEHEVNSAIIDESRQKLDDINLDVEDPPTCSRMNHENVLVGDENEIDVSDVPPKQNTTRHLKDEGYLFPIEIPSNDIVSCKREEEDCIEETLCPICIDTYDDGNTIIHSKNCSHFFHKDCIFQWLEKNDDCPCCRKNMITPQELFDATLKVINKGSLRRTIETTLVTPTTSPSRSISST